MNEPIAKPIADPDIGPLDEFGQQIWSPEEDAAIARVWATPEAQAALARAEADIAAGRVFTHEEVQVRAIERKRRWFAEKGIAAPPGYFD